MKGQKTAVALAVRVPWGCNQRVRYCIQSGRGFLFIPSVFYCLKLSQLKGSSAGGGAVLTCHNTAFLDIQQKGPAAGRFSFTAVAEDCLNLLVSYKVLIIT